MTPNIVENLQTVHKRITSACQKHQRSASDVKLLAVSKTVSAQRVYEAIQVGQLAFGENYLQEATDKIPAVAQLLSAAGTASAQPQWHFIGSIQSNKTAQIARHFDWVHTIDRLKVAQRLSRHRQELTCDAQRPRPPLQVCLQINSDAAPGKSGIAPQKALELAQAVSQLPELQLRGLMHIPDPVGIGDDSTPNAHFHAMYARHRVLYQLLETLQQQLQLPQLDTLSMGMSDDLGSAIAAGSTMVRVGTAIFGAR